MNEELIIQQFYEKLQEIVGASYEMSQASSLENDELLNGLNTEHEKCLNALKHDIQFWLNPSLFTELSDENQATYKANILKRIKSTLTLLRNFIEHSDIFPNKDDETYKNLIAVLKTPENPEPIDPNTNDVEGLFYKDLTHNQAYWDENGERHLILMNNLAGFLEQLIENQADENHKEDCRLALEIIFTTNKNQYGVCAGGHNNNIELAKTTLSAKSPKENIVSYWKKYKSSLMGQSFGILNKNLIERINIGDQVHLPPATDILFGVDKNIIAKKDRFALDTLKRFNIENLAMLRDQLYDFHKFLYESLSTDIDSRLKGFDALKDFEKNNKIDEIMSKVINSFWDKDDAQLYTLREAFCIYETFQFKKAEEIKEIILDRLSSRIPKILGIDEECNLKELKDKELTKEKKDDLLVKGPLGIEALKTLTNFNIDTVYDHYERLSIFSRHELSVYLAFYEKEQFDLLMERLTEENRKLELACVLKVLLIYNKIEPFNSVLNDYLSNKKYLDILEELGKICINKQDEVTLGILFDKINEVDVKQKTKLKAFKNVLLHAGLAENNQIISQSCLTVIAEKIPTNKRNEVFKKVLSHLSKSETYNQNLHEIFDHVERLNLKISLDKMWIPADPEKIIQKYLKHHRSIKNLGTLVNTIYNSGELNEASKESILSTIDKSHDNKRLLLKMSTYPKWNSFRPLSKLKSFISGGIGFGIGILASVVFAAVSAATALTALPLIALAVLAVTFAGVGVSLVIPGKFELKNRKKIKLIKRYAALNLSLYDNKQKKFNKILNALKSEQQNEFIERLLAIAINQEQDNYAKLNTILNGIKSIKDPTMIQRLFKDALVKHIGNENLEGFMVLLNNVPEEGKNEIIGHAISQCAVNADQEGFDKIMNSEVSQEVKDDAIKHAVSQCVMNANQESLDLIMNSEVSQEVKDDAIKHAVSQCVMNANQESLDLIMNREVSQEIKNDAIKHAVSQCVMNANQEGLDVIMNSNASQEVKDEAIKHAVSQCVMNANQEGLDMIMNSNASKEIKNDAIKHAVSQCVMNANQAGFQMAINKIPEVEKNEFIDNLMQNTPKGSPGEELLARMRMGFQVPTISNEGAGNTIKMRQKKSVMSSKVKGNSSRLLKPGKQTSRV